MKLDLAGRIPCLDGLRAFSIIFVITCHIHNNGWLPGLHLNPYLYALLADGDFGVRVFFVISGFLITSLLLQEQEKHGRISLKAFYKRRVARIFPAFYAYLAFVAVLILLGHAETTWPTMAVTGLYLANVKELILGTAVAGGWFIGHTWSLAMEEQFYLVWPALMRYFSRRTLTWLLYLAVFGTPLLRTALWLKFPALRDGLMNFLTAADLILVGSLVAFYAVHGIPKIVQRLVDWRFTPWFVVGLQVLLLPFLLSLTSHKGTLQMLTVSLPSAGMAVLILWLLARDGTLWHKVLNNRVIAFIGVISYSLYLWQQPFTRNRDLVPVPFPVNLMLVAGCALASYYMVEKPARAYLRKAMGA